ncbi:unnamed protein product [Effrenium voratum]|nr:unnamed protein product [Effrenium voratum]
MACALPLAEAGVSLEQQGHRLLVRDLGGCAIRNRGGEALASFLKSNQQIRALDLRESNISDNGLAQLCLALRQTNQLEELQANPVGHTGLEFLLGVVQRCSRLHTLTIEVCDVPTLFSGRQNVSSADYDTSDYVVKEEEELEEEEAEAKLAKEERLRKAFAENNYDSGDESVPSAPVDNDVSSALTKLLDDLVTTVRSKGNLLAVDCRGESRQAGERTSKKASKARQAVPSDVRLDIHRAAEEHQVLQQRRLAEQQERGARTGTDVLQAQMREIESLLEGQESSIEGALPGEDLRSTHMGIRSYIGRRLHAALGEALFECQRFKSKGNKALATPQDEIAFIAMYLRKKMEEEQAAEA